MDGDILNVLLVIALFVEGYIIKNVNLFKNVNNNAIPFILIITSIIVSGLSLKEFDVETIVTAMCNAFVSVGLHQTTKVTSKTDLVLTLLSTFRNLIGKGAVDDVGNSVNLEDIADNSDEDVETTEDESTDENT